MKIFITTSHRPTPRTRSLVKDLVSVVPGSIRLTRGKMTLALLALQAFDLGVERAIVLRNWKGNPRFIDVYTLSTGRIEFVKVCTLILCGFSLSREVGHVKTSTKPVKICMVYPKELDSFSENILECLVRAFNIQFVENVEYVCRDHKSVLFIEFSKRIHRGKNAVEVKFRNCSGKYVGPVLRFCGAKIVSS